MDSSTILITGASRGIGAHISRRLARPGRTLLLLARTHEALYGTAKACNLRGAKVVTFGVDLADPQQISTFLDQVTDFNIDMIVNNAGVMYEEALPWETDPDNWWKTLEINVRAPYLLARGLVPRMLANAGGRIVDLSSGAAVYDSSLASGYFVSKTALLRFAGSLHEAGYERGLKVFSVAPGVVQTDMTANRIMHQDRTEWNSPDEVSEIIALIADGELDALAGSFIRAGSDSIAELTSRARNGIGAVERKLRLTPWEH
ncbi:SDR family NAD(P)-dependent oxidoreductase [Arcanobacterium pinnipediorum]|uniref:SDR family oxidoreductase n=1 Tax=Arcanobacterium pinnipediorum TaxID=1503041 RepID=A0ABY5AGV9_9ACTO|nr:SDR family oxidoreductase [Arcanobacterium pinnipediorum]USR78721.1 SDR family oxidoreductase [Arcanobacterium pinnipediorum]